MRVTLDDDGYVYFDGIDVGFLADTRMTIADYEKLQAYIASANEAFDAMKHYCDEKYPAHAYGTLFKEILQKVGD